VEPTAHLAPNKKPLTSREDRRKESNQKQARRVRKTHGTFIRTKGKIKNQTKTQLLESSLANSTVVARLGIIEVLGRPNGPSILAAHSKKRKEIVQYHPPRGRP